AAAVAGDESALDRVVESLVERFLAEISADGKRHRARRKLEDLARGLEIHTVALRLGIDEIGVDVRRLLRRDRGRRVGTEEVDLAAVQERLHDPVIEVAAVGVLDRLAYVVIQRAVPVPA